MPQNVNRFLIVHKLPIRMHMLDCLTVNVDFNLPYALLTSLCFDFMKGSKSCVCISTNRKHVNLFLKDNNNPICVDRQHLTCY